LLQSKDCPVEFMSKHLQMK